MSIAIQAVRLAVLTLLTAAGAATCAAAEPAALPPSHAARSGVHAEVLGFSVANMDRRADPRQDFYRYAVGGWLDRTSIPASEPDFGGFSQLAAQLDERLLTLVHEAAARKGQPKGSPGQQVGDFFRAATDLGRLNALGLKPVEADLERASTVAVNDPVAMARLSARLQLGYVMSPILNAVPTTDFKDSSAVILALGPGVQALAQDEYLKPEGKKVRDQYLTFITKMFLSVGESPQDAVAHAHTVLDVETALAGAQLTPVQARDPQVLYNRMSLKEAQAMVPAVDLATLLAELGMQAPDTVLVPDLAGLRQVQDVWHARSAQDRHTVLRWHVLSARAAALGSPWQDMDREFNRLRKGIQTDEPREREVVKLASSLLFHPMSRLYVARYFPDATRRQVTEMVGHIKDEFAQRLRTNVWLDEATRAAALDKLAKVDIQVGYPSQWIDFSSVDVRPGDHFGNSQRLGAFLMRRELARLGKPVVKERFAAPNMTTPIAVNAAYNPTTNSIDITSAIVQPPFYKPGADAAVNYCTMGAVIGHELTHGFDSFGRQFGPAGNLRDWWTPQAAAEFKQRTDELVAQYSAFEVLPGLMHKGQQTVTENTADLGGITLAHAALKRHLAGKPDTRIDGLSTDQRCFVAWAQTWAYKARPERLRLLVSIDYHAITSLRATGPLVHLDAFHEAFGTREGDPMWRAPDKRVRIW